MRTVQSFFSTALAATMTLALVSAPRAATVTLDGKTEYQVMEGIGGYGSIYPSHMKGADPVYTQQFVDLLVDDMGASMIRIQVPPAFEVTNDNSDPNNTDLSKFNIDQTSSDKCKYRIRTIAQEVPYWKALQQAARANGEDIRIIATIWSPPWWMKISNCVYGMDRSTCQLKSTMHEELAEYCEAFVRIFKRETGFDLYAFSFQNEPDFTEPYQSCVYEGDEYVAAFEVIAERFARKGLSTRFFGPEDMAQRVNLNYGAAFYNSQAIRDHLHAYACHGYSNGVDPTPSSEAVKAYTQVGGFANVTLGKPAWMTETGGYGTTWSSAILKAEAMYTAMYYGNFAAWVRWTWEDEVIDDGTKRYPQYASYKHFAKWTRPGAIRIDSESDNGSVYTLAFNHKQNQTLTVILVNSGSATQCALAGDNLPSSFQAFQSKAAGDYAPSIGTVQASGFSLPGSSITTLYATGYQEDGAVDVDTRPAARSRTVRANADIRAVYTLDGRRMGGTDARALARGIPGAGIRGAAVYRMHDGRTATGVYGISD